MIETAGIGHAAKKFSWEKILINRSGVSFYLLSIFKISWGGTTVGYKEMKIVKSDI